MDTAPERWHEIMTTSFRERITATPDGVVQLVRGVKATDLAKMTGSAPYHAGEAFTQATQTITRGMGLGKKRVKAILDGKTDLDKADREYFFDRVFVYFAHRINATRERLTVHGFDDTVRTYPTLEKRMGLVAGWTAYSRRCGAAAYWISDNIDAPEGRVAIVNRLPILETPSQLWMPEAGEGEKHELQRIAGLLRMMEITPDRAAVILAIADSDKRSELEDWMRTSMGLKHESNMAAAMYTLLSHARRVRVEARKPRRAERVQIGFATDHITQKYVYEKPKAERKGAGSATRAPAPPTATARPTIDPAPAMLGWSYSQYEYDTCTYLPAATTPQKTATQATVTQAETQTPALPAPDKACEHYTEPAWWDRVREHLRNDRVFEADALLQTHAEREHMTDDEIAMLAAWLQQDVDAERSEQAEQREWEPLD